jgi:hypothetical protein
LLRSPPMAAAGAATGIAATAASDASRTTTTAPSEIFSPSATRISFTTPAADDGTSIVALSDSRVTSASSTLTTSPTMTQMSITGTSW